IEDAEQRLLEAAETYLEENCEKKIQVSGKCDDIFFRKFGIFIACGQMVGIVSEELDIDREIRAIKVKKYLENEEQPYRYELTLSDFLDTNGFKDLVNDVNKFPDEIESNIRPVKEWTKRSWRDVMETFRMMFDPEGEYFTELIKPLAVHTAQLIVGTNSQQFELVGIRFIPNANHNANAFQSTAGRLIHFTVNQDGITEWTIPVSSYSLNNSYPYYVYARCSKTAASGTIIATTEQIKLEAKDGYYHFWIGVLNTPQDGVRSWNPNYGYTEIAGQTITTGIIKDKNSNLVIDLTKGTLTGYGNITDKPDLSGFASKSELKVLGDEISLSVTREINGVKQDLSKIEAKADQINIQVEGLKDGDTLVSYINLSKTTAIISSKRIKLEGYITANEHFKIDEDGDMECINGKFSGQITATSGTIGGFSIASSYIGVAASGTETTGATGFSISPTLIRYSNSSIWAGFGSYVFPASMGGSFNCPMRISMNTGEYSSDYKYGNIGIYLNVSGKATYDDVELSGNHALYIPEGYITGFRLRPRRISSTTTLTNLDSWIFGIGSNTFTLYLPSSPKDGQIYFIRKVTSGNINITVSNSAHKLRRNWNAEDTSVTLKDGNMAIIMWDNVNKYWT
ncbi:MAG: hypothetical protein LUD74_02800, partial [Tannerellaceae bacterium]|nr:hypothetical protein [Tannerellaceae bacterium]